MSLDKLPRELIRECLLHLDHVDEKGRDNVAQTSRVLRQAAADAFDYHTKLSRRFPAYAARPSSAVLHPKSGAALHTPQQVLWASRRAHAFYAAREQFESSAFVAMLGASSTLMQLNQNRCRMLMLISLRTKPLRRAPEHRHTQWIRRAGVPAMRSLSRCERVLPAAAPATAAVDAPPQ